jgi:hypothetical protein
MSTIIELKQSGEYWIEGRQPPWKKTSMADDLHGRQPPWKTTFIGDDLNNWKSAKYNEKYVFSGKTQIWNSTLRFNLASARKLT